MKRDPFSPFTVRRRSTTRTQRANRSYECCLNMHATNLMKFLEVVKEIVGGLQEMLSSECA